MKFGLVLLLAATPTGAQTPFYLSCVFDSPREAKGASFNLGVRDDTGFLSFNGEPWTPGNVLAAQISFERGETTFTIDRLSGRVFVTANHPSRIIASGACKTARERKF